MNSFGGRTRRLICSGEGAVMPASLSRKELLLSMRGLVCKLAGNMIACFIGICAWLRSLSGFNDSGFNSPWWWYKLLMWSQEGSKSLEKSGSPHWTDRQSHPQVNASSDTYYRHCIRMTQTIIQCESKQMRVRRECIVRIKYKTFRIISNQTCDALVMTFFCW